MADAWYYTLDGRTQLGPVSFLQLQQLAAQEQLKPAYHVRRTDETRWLVAADVPNLFPSGFKDTPLAEGQSDVIVATLVGEETPVAAIEVQAPTPSMPSSEILAALQRILRRLATFAGVVMFLIYLISIIRLAHVLGLAYQQDRDLRDLMICFHQRRDWASEVLPDGKLKLELWDEKVQQQDYENLAGLFPDDEVRSEVLEWGRQLVASWRGPYAQKAARIERQPLSPEADQLTDFQKVRSVPVTERLAGHAVWRRLLSAPGASAKDLGHLKEVVQRAIPDVEQRQKLLAWSELRRKQKDVVVRSFYHDIPSYSLAPPPPGSEWFDYWVLYDDWAATDEVLAARKADLLGTFGGRCRFSRDLWRTFLEWGNELAERRGENLGFLAMDGQRAAIIAATDRLAGLEPDGHSNTRAFLEEQLDLPAFRQGNILAILDNIFFELAQYLSPSDEYLYLSAGPGSIADRSFAGLPNDGRSVLEESETPKGLWAQTGYVVVWSILVGGAAWLVYRGMRFVTIDAAAYALKLLQNPRYQSFRNFRKRPRWANVTAAVVILLTFVTALVFIERFHILYLQSYVQLLLVVAWSVLLGGILVEAFANFITLCLIRCGQDPARSWFDDILALLVSLPLLRFFGNNWYIIAFSLSIGLTPSILHKLLDADKSTSTWIERYSPTALYQRHPGKTLLGGCAVVAFLCLLLCCGGPVSMMGNAIAQRQAARIRGSAEKDVQHSATAAQLAADYRRDAKATLQKYHRHRLLVSGTSLAGGKHPSADFCLPLETDAQDVVVRCLFDGAQAKFAEDCFRDHVGVVGEFAGANTEGRLTFLTLQNCCIPGDR